MTKVKEYYPSLMVTDYQLGEVCMFIRNTTFEPKRISKEHKNYILEEMKGGLAPDEERGGLAPDNIENVVIGGLAPDDDTNLGEIGGLAPEQSKTTLPKDEISSHNRKNKIYGVYSYEAGRIIGINEKESKLYVQFADTVDGYCHIFKAGISSDDFDKLDKLIQASGK